MRVSEEVFLNFWGALESIPIQGIDSASLCSLLARYIVYDNPIPTRFLDKPIPTQFLAPIDCSKIPAQEGVQFGKTDPPATFLIRIFSFNLIKESYFTLQNNNDNKKSHECYWSKYL